MSLRIATVLLVPTLALARTPHPSWALATLSNGHAVAVFDRTTSRLQDAWPHPYQEALPGRITPDLLWDAYFGLSRGGPGLWLPSLRPLTEAYENGTGVFVVVRELPDLRLTERWFAPYSLEAPVVVAHLTVRNLGSSPMNGLRVAFLQNFHVGEDLPEASFRDERIRWAETCSCLVEEGSRSGRHVVTVPAPLPEQVASSPSNPYVQFPRDGSLGTLGPDVPQDDAISALAWDLPTLPPGQEVAVAVAFGLAEEGSPEDLGQAIRAWLTTNPLEAERESWRAFHARDSWPGNLRGPALAVARQAVAWLAMGQVREPDGPGRTPRGQILASLPPGNWSRTWVRDQAYAIAALAASGHADLGANAVGFLARARVGQYRGIVGRDYGVSVCRYYGHGLEESDGDPAVEGPNIEFDGFGLALWSLAEVATRRPEVLSEAWEWASDRVAMPLASLIQDTGLVRPDSSIWERHFNGREKHFTYTQASAVLGLCAAAEMADRLGDSRATAWRLAARQVARAIETRLVTPTGVLAGSLEEIPTGRFLDASVVETFLWGILPADGTAARRTLEALLGGLSVPPGLRRNDDGDWYDRQEWVFIDLRVAEALRRAGRTREAEDLVSWVLDQTRANLDLPAELYEETTADYQGAVPMMGFGAGALLLALLRPDPAVGVPACLGQDAPEAPGEDPEPAESVEEGSVPETPEASPEATDSSPEPPESYRDSGPSGDPAEADLRDVPAASEIPGPSARTSSGCGAGTRTPPSRGWIGLLGWMVLGVRRRLGSRWGGLAGTRPGKTPG